MGRGERAAHFVPLLTLLTCALAREEADGLLQGLSPPFDERACALAREQLRQDSTARQARLRAAFHSRAQRSPDLRGVLPELGEGLRHALLHRLPPYLRPPGALPPGQGLPALPPAGRAWLERLVKECSR